MKSESYIEHKVFEFAERLGWKQWKWGENGYPDRVFLKNGRHIYIEFKAPGKKVRPLQSHRIKELREQGAEVYVIDDVEAGQTILASAAT